MEQLPVFSAETLFLFTTQILEKVGFSAEDAKAAADVLIEADLRGIDSHGVARLDGYVNLVKAGRLNPSPNLKIVSEAMSAATVDADKAVGLVSGQFAMNLAIEKAKKTGIGMVTVKNSNHFGIGYFHTRLALNEGMIGISMTNASAFVAPAYGLDRMLGTNPMCYAFPGKNGDHVVADLATSAAANGKLEIAERLGKQVPEGWVMHSDGTPSTNPAELKHGGLMLPLGSFEKLGFHKGYALASVVDIFCGVLSGANFGPFVPPFPAYAPLPEKQVGEGIGHCFMAIRVDAFRPEDEYYQAIETWKETFRKSKAVEGHRVQVPGEPEFRFEQERRNGGIPLVTSVVEKLNKLAAEFSVDPLP